MKKVEHILRKLKGIEGGEKSSDSKINKFLFIKFPGTSKTIKVETKKFFDKMDENNVKFLSEHKFLDLSNFKVVKTDHDTYKLEHGKIENQFYQKLK